MDRQYVKGKCLFTKNTSYYQQYNYLTKDSVCDILVVGGGVTGAIAGYYFSKNGINTIVIDKSRIAHGSTSITTSLLQYELDDNANELKSVISDERIKRSYELGLFALDEIEDFVAEHGNSFDYKRVDSLLFTSKKSEITQMEDEYNFRKKCGFNVEYVTPETNKFGFDIEAGVLAKKGGATIDPVKFAHSLLSEGTKHGMKVYENTEARKITYHNDYAEVETEYGFTIKCKKVVCATGYNPFLFTNRKFATMSTTFNIVTAPISNSLNALSNIVARDNHNPYHYFRTTTDNRIIMGGEDIRFEPDFDNDSLCEKSYGRLEHILHNLLPNIDTKIEYKYCGAFATTKDNLGFIGADNKHSNLWYCLGYGANGILFAILGGYFLSKLYLGNKDENMSLFKVDRFE